MLCSLQTQAIFLCFMIRLGNRHLTDRTPLYHLGFDVYLTELPPMQTFRIPVALPCTERISLLVLSGTTKLENWRSRACARYRVYSSSKSHAQKRKITVPGIHPGTQNRFDVLLPASAVRARKPLSLDIARYSTHANTALSFICHGRNRTHIPFHSRRRPAAARSPSPDLAL